MDIYLKFIGRFDFLAPELTPEEEKRQASLHRHWVKSRERYQMIKASEHAVGQPFKLICKCCGEEFESGWSNTLFCSPNCWAKFYRQEAAENRKRECVFGNCRKAFTTTRNDVKYCCEACQRKTHSKMRYRQKQAGEQEADLAVNAFSDIPQTHLQCGKAVTKSTHFSLPSALAGLANRRFASGKAVSSKKIRLFLSMVCTLAYCWYWRYVVFSMSRTSSSGMYLGSASQWSRP